MAHQSETNIRLQVVNMGETTKQKFSENDVWFIKLPYYKKEASIPNISEIVTDLNQFIENSNSNATIAILTSPNFAAHFLSELTPWGNLKLWVGVKLKTPYESETGLKQHHGALIIITRYSGSLQHTKTRIAYTFCPTCERTTKDYGGKKHLYHEYGTLMSDVWRDIEIDFDNNIEPITDRLQDLFGLKPYKYLKIIDLSKTYPPIFNEKTTQISQSEFNNFEYKGSAKSMIINGDSLEVLKEIPSNSVDFCFADPPYNVNKKYENWDDGIDIREYFEWCDKWLSELGRIIKPGKTVAVLNIPQWAIRHFKYLKNILNFQDWILWEGLSLPVRMIMPAHYSILCFTKGKSQTLPGLKREKHSKLELESLTTIEEFYCNRASCIKKRQKQNVNDKSIISNLWWDIHRLNIIARE